MYNIKSCYDSILRTINSLPELEQIIDSKGVGRLIIRNNPSSASVFVEFVDKTHVEITFEDYVQAMIWTWKQNVIVKNYKSITFQLSEYYS